MFTKKFNLFVFMVSCILSLTVFMSLAFCLVLVSPSWGQSVPADVTKEVNGYVKNKIPSLVELFNNKCTNDLGNAELLNIALNNKMEGATAPFDNWVAHIWLECYYKDAVLIYPGKRKAYEGSTVVIQMAIEQKLQ